MLIHREQTIGEAVSKYYLFDTYEKAAQMVSNILPNSDKFKLNDNVWQYYTSLYAKNLENLTYSSSGKFGFFGSFEIKNLELNPSKHDGLFLCERL